MTRPEEGLVDGILPVHKPAGISSARAVAVVKHALAGVKTGHLGTLDPFASGLLPMCLGEATKAARYLNTLDKAYCGVIRLGVTTDTLDRTGKVLSSTDPADPEVVDLEALAAVFSGRIEQVPPVFSAIKRGGTPMYRLARMGQAPMLAPRQVTIYRLALRWLDRDLIALEAECSKGTYIRSLARDIGMKLGCGAILEELCRVRFGPFQGKDAVVLDSLASPQGRRAALHRIVRLGAALGHLQRLDVSAAAAARLRAGQQEGLAALAPPQEPGKKARILEPGGSLVAVVCEAHGHWCLERTFRPPACCTAQIPMLEGSSQSKKRKNA